MLIKTLFVVILAVVSAIPQSLDVTSKQNSAKDLTSDSSKLATDLIAAETGGKGFVVGGGKEDIIAKKGIVKGIKAGRKNLVVGGKQFGKKLGKIEGKKFDKKFLKKNSKAGAFGAIKKGFKKFGKKGAFNKIKGSGFKKKSFNVKSFNENKAFKFGKVNGFNLATGVAAGFAKKGGKFKGLSVNALDKKIKGGKKEFIDVKGAKGLKKLSQAGKLGFKKGGGKFIKKKKLKGAGKLKKIG